MKGAKRVRVRKNTKRNEMEKERRNMEKMD
jgi:hypothetical protein